MNKKEYKIKVKLLPGINVLVITKDPKDRFFYTNETGIVISVQALSTLILFLIKNGFLHYKVLEGILEEYHSNY